MDALVTAADEIEKVGVQFEGGLSRILSNLKTVVADGAASGSLGSGAAFNDAGAASFGAGEHQYQQLHQASSSSKDTMDVLHSHLAVNQSFLVF